MRFILLGLLALLAAGAAHACPQNTVRIGEERQQVGNRLYVTEICRRAPPCSSLPGSPEEIAREQAGLRRELQGNTNEAVHIADALEEWAAMDRQARAQVRKRALGLSVELAVSETLTRSQAVLRQRTLDARAAAGLQRDWGYVVTRLSQMSPTVRVHVLRPVNQARTAEQAVEGLQHGMNTINATYDAGVLANETNWENFWAAALSAAQLTEGLLYSNPYTALLVSDLQAGENALYGWWAVLAARNRLRQFAALEDRVLADSIREANRYVALTAALAAIRRGEPYCLRGVV